MATKAAAPRRHRSHKPRPQPVGIPKLQPLNIWAILSEDGAAGVVTLVKGQAPTQLSNGKHVIYATKLGDTHNQAQAYSRFNKWAGRHASFLREAVHGGKSTRVIFNRAMGGGGALVHATDEATGDPIPGIAFVVVATAGTAAAVGVPGAILGGEAGGAAEGAAAGGAAAGAEGAAAGGAAGGGVAGGAAKLAGKAAALAGTGAVAGLFTNVGWWKGLGMMVIGVVLGVLAIREFSP